MREFGIWKTALKIATLVLKLWVNLVHDFEHDFYEPVEISIGTIQNIQQDDEQKSRK